MAGEDHEPATEAAPTAEETFALVGNEVRAGILRTLSDARGGEGSPPSLSFSELRSRVDADVRSSQFNYHLQQLVGQFVEKRADGNAQLVDDVVDRKDDGYALRPEGTMLTRTIRARTTGDESVDRLAVDLDCYHCRTPVEATYRNSIFRMQCPDCEYLYEYDLVPPGVLDDDERTLLSQVGEHQRHVRPRRLSALRKRRRRAVRSPVRHGVPASGPARSVYQPSVRPLRPPELPAGRRGTPARPRADIVLPRAGARRDDDAHLGTGVRGNRPLHDGSLDRPLGSGPVCLARRRLRERRGDSLRGPFERRLVGHSRR